MKKLKFVIFKFFVIVTLIMSFQTVFATGKTVIIIRKDDFPEPPPYQPCGMTALIPVSATVNETDLAVYFETSLGDVTITVTNDSDQAVYQETIDTGLLSEAHMTLTQWNVGNYKLIITCQNSVLMGEFLIE